MTDLGTPVVKLVAVDEPTLRRLVQAAVSGAAANEVTAPLTAEDVWSAPRIAWLEDFHRARMSGLDGDSAEATWAILFADQIVGSVRLKRTAEPEILETGIWLDRGVRGQGVGLAAMAELLRLAADLGARGVRADTRTGNAPALGLIQRLGLQVVVSEDGNGVEALILFGTA